MRARRSEFEKVRADADYLRHAFGELEKLDARAGEEEELASRRAAMMQAEKVVSDLRDVAEAVSGDHSPMSALSAALRRLQRRQTQAPALIEPAAQALDAAISALDLAGQALDDALRDANFDPGELEQVEERLFALRAASRKYSVAADNLPQLAETFGTQLADLDAGEAKLRQLTEAVAAAEAAFVGAAKELSRARHAAAKALDRAVNAELPPLKLEGARFSTAIAAEAAGPEGVDQIEFWVQTNPGTRPGPLMKIASGGELARFMLALKVVLADRGSAPTLVFDEIDTGAGGAVADAIGQRLARLAKGVQVLAVTHAPQVAARAEDHLRIAKDPAGAGRVATRVLPLGHDARREEIARMLAGATITDEARAAAARLMRGAGVIPDLAARVHDHSVPRRSDRSHAARYGFLQIPDAANDLEAEARRSMRLSGCTTARPPSGLPDASTKRSLSRSSIMRARCVSEERADLARRQQFLRQGAHFRAGFSRLSRRVSGCRPIDCRAAMASLSFASRGSGAKRRCGRCRRSPF